MSGTRNVIAVAITGLSLLPSIANAEDLPVIGTIEIPWAGGLSRRLEGGRLWAYGDAGSAPSGVIARDVTDPDFTFQLLSVTIPGATGSYVWNDHAYLVDTDQLVIFDVSQPGPPPQLGSLVIDRPSPIDWVTAGDGHVFVIAGPEIVWVDVQDPEAPLIRLVFSHPGFGVYGTAWMVGDLLYANSTDGIHVLEIVSGPGLPSMARVELLAGLAGTPLEGDGFVYLYDEYSPTIRMLDTSTPEDPFEVASFSLPSHVFGGAALDGDRLCVGLSSTIELYDVSSPAVPAHLDSLTPLGATVFLGIAGCGTHVFFNSSAIALTGPSYGVVISPPTSLRAIESDLLYIYVGYESGGMWIYETTEVDPAPFVGGIGAPPIQHLAVDGDFVLAATGVGLQLIDVSDRSNPILRGALSTAAAPTDVALAFPRGFATIGSDVHAYDLSDPDTLAIGDVHTPAAPVVGIDTRSSTLVVATSTAGVQLLDASNPALLVTGVTLDGFGEIGAIDVAGPWLYVAHSSGALEGITSFDINDPSAPALIEATPRPAALPWPAYQLSAAAGRVAARTGSVMSGPAHWVEQKGPAPALTRTYGAFAFVGPIELAGPHLYVGQLIGRGATIHAVPEASALDTLGAGIIALAALNRRRRLRTRGAATLRRAQSG